MATARVARGSLANLGGLALRQSPPKLAGHPQLLAAPSGDHDANVSVGTLIYAVLAAEGILVQFNSCFFFTSLGIINESELYCFA